MIYLCFHPASESPTCSRFLWVSRLDFSSGTVSCWRMQIPQTQRNFAEVASVNCSKTLPELASSAPLSYSLLRRGSSSPPPNLPGHVEDYHCNTLLFQAGGGGVGPSFFSRECFQYLIFMLDWNETRFQSSELLCETLLWAASFFGENTSKPDTG